MPKISEKSVKTAVYGPKVAKFRISARVAIFSTFFAILVEMANIFRIYIICDLQNECAYVGSTERSLADRLHEHSRNKNSAVYLLLKEDYKVQVKVYKQREDEAYLDFSKRRLQTEQFHLSALKEAGFGILNKKKVIDLPSDFLPAELQSVK